MTLPSWLSLLEVLTRCEGRFGSVFDTGQTSLEMRSHLLESVGGGKLNVDAIRGFLEDVVRHSTKVAVGSHFLNFVDEHSATDNTAHRVRRMQHGQPMHITEVAS